MMGKLTTFFFWDSGNQLVYAVQFFAEAIGCHFEHRVPLYLCILNVVVGKVVIDSRHEIASLYHRSY